MKYDSQLEGKRFGRLLVLKKRPPVKGNAIWLCRCECGAETKVRGYNLISGHSKSCGCLTREVASSIRITHGDSHARVYNIWNHMIKRCSSESNKAFKDYGGRGVSVCNEWASSYEAFRSWALNNGYSDSLSINRIDNNGNYCPSNCEWVDMKTQNRNRRDNVLIKFNGATRCLSEWAELIGINPSTLRRRIFISKWPLGKAFTNEKGE